MKSKRLAIPTNPINSGDVCCRAMSGAFDKGTSDSGDRMAWINYGRLHFGPTLPELKYCPWCGTPIDWEWLED